jgi:hypothetical protein
MAKLAIYWGAAAVVAVGVVLLHLFGSAWVAARVPELQRPLTDPTPLSPWAKVIMLGYLALSVGGAVGVPLLIFAGLSARDEQRWAAQRRQWEAEQAAQRERWERERQEWQRLQEIRDQLWLERLPPEERERTLARRREQQELEARARAILEAERRGEADGR